MTPQRIQLSRAKGWRMPGNTVVVSRPSKWGNPCSAKPPLDQAYARHAFYNWLTGCKIRLDMYGPPPSHDEIIAALRGKNLACWCKPGTPCHADVLLELANAPRDNRDRDALNDRG